MSAVAHSAKGEMRIANFELRTLNGSLLWSTVPITDNRRTTLNAGASTKRRVSASGFNPSQLSHDSKHVARLANGGLVDPFPGRLRPRTTSSYQWGFHSLDAA